MFILKEILQNFLMGFKILRNFSKRYHSTGINNRPEEIEKVYNFYTNFSDVKEKSILEIGPGHTTAVLEKALKKKARQATAIDVIEYIDKEKIKNSKINYNIYDGRAFPYPNNSFDLVWSYDVFEHVRYPYITIPEIYRVLKPGGLSINQIDLRDHYNIDSKNNETKLFECLKYSKKLWNLMTWDRSAYVNRLRYSEWINLYKTSGFEIIYTKTEISEVIKKLYQQGKLKYLKKYSGPDAITSTLIIVGKKNK